MSFIARRFFAITPGPGPIVGPLASDGKPIGYCNGFVANADGTMSVVGLGGPSDAGSAVTIQVLKGVRYDFALKFVLAATGPTSIIGFV